MFFLVAINIREMSDTCHDIKDMRTFGYFSDEPTAWKAAEENWADMHECLYNYLLIEELGEGIHPIPKGIRDGSHERWYHWEPNAVPNKSGIGDGNWVRCDKPEFLKQTICFALG